MTTPSTSKSSDLRRSERKPTISPLLVLATIGLMLSAVAAAIVYLRFEPTYQARYRLQVNTDYIAFPKEEQPSLGFIRTETELIRSPLVLQPLMDDLQILKIPEIVGADDPVEYLAEAVSVEPVDGTSLFDVTYSASNAGHAAYVVNAVVDSYFSLRNTQDEKRTQEVLDVLKAAEARWAVEVKRAEERLRGLAIDIPEISGINAKADAKPLPSSLSQIRVELILLEGEKQELEVLIRALRDPHHGDESVHQRQQAEVREMERLGVSTYLVHKQEVARIQELDKFREDELQRHQQKLAALDAKISYLQSQLHEEVDRSKRGQGYTVDLEFARYKLDQCKEVHNRILARMIQIETERPIEPVLKQMSASPPTHPVEQLPYRHLVLAALAGFLSPFAIVAMWKLRRRANEPRGR